MSAPPPATAETASWRWQRIVVRGWRTLLVSCVIAVCIWALQPQNSFGATLVYSLCISLSCWLLIDFGRELVASRLAARRVGSPVEPTGWPGWPWMIGIVVGGGIVGYAIGNEIANVLTGFDSPGPFTASWRQLTSLLVFALVPAIVVTYFFHSRAVIDRQQAAVERAERHAAEQQLRLLESQLEPHMLFNTLANLRALIAVDPERAQTMLDTLIGFLRASLAGSRAATHSLTSEFARIADYLSLMEIRMGSRLTTRLELPEGLARASIPSLLLQPLVENAIRHGLEPKREGGHIDVVASATSGHLVLTVRDTGVGLVAAALATGLMAANGEPSGGYGLDHVRERLSALYGPEASFELADAEGDEGGAVATVRLPMPGGTRP